jgi:2-dehydropantoate 2-reductase
VDAGATDEAVIAVVGAGAVGSYFGGMLARAGEAVTLIGRAAHVDAIRRDGLRIESLSWDETIPVTATTDLASVPDARVVLVSVKTIDTAEIARAIGPMLAPGALVVSLQNGIENVSVMRDVGGFGAIPAVVYVAAAVVAPGHVRHTGRGDLILGVPQGVPQRAPAEELARAFERAGVPCRMVDDPAPDLWIKLVMNCAFNAVSALADVKYGAIVAHPAAREVVTHLVEEAQAVARKAGVRLPEADLSSSAWKLAAAMPGATSSTAQDLARGRRTEIEALNGYIARKGRELGVPTPINEALSALVQLREAQATAPETTP